MSKPTDAWLRSGAGPMKDRRAPRGGERAAVRQEIDEALDDFSQGPGPEADTSIMSNATTEETKMAKPRYYNEVPELMLSRAIALAAKAHEKQTYGGQPYILHALRVMQDVLSTTGDMELAQAAVLHDVLEDGTPFEASEVFDYTPRVVAAVQGVTRSFPNSETYADFIERAASHEDSRIIKVADLMDHMAHRETLRPSLAKRYTQALDRLTKASS